MFLFDTFIISSYCISFKKGVQPGDSSVFCLGVPKSFKILLYKSQLTEKDIA